MRGLTIIVLVTFISLIAVRFAHADLTDGLVAYYPFNGNANDESGNGHHAAVTGATLTNDRLGSAGGSYNFDGVDDFIEVPDNPAFHLTKKMTIAAWVNPFRLFGLQTIVNKWYVPDSYGLFIEGGDFVYNVAFPGGPWGQTVAVHAPTTVGTWRHVAGVLDGQNMFLYINGQLKDSKETSGALQDSDRPIVIGNHPSWNAFKGLIDEVRIYNRALSESDIQDLVDTQDSQNDLILPINAYKIPVLVLAYYPDENNDGLLDSAIVGSETGGKPVAEIETKVTNITTLLIETLEYGSTYHGYKNPNARPSLDYSIVDFRTFAESIPVSKKFPPFADHMKILNELEICDFVENKGVKEVWIWMYHTNVISPIESNMSGPYGDISNSYRQDDLPHCKSTYTVYNYNYGRSISEATENHMHQIEHVLNYVDGRDMTPTDQWGSLLFWGNFVGSDISHEIIKPGCGWSHYPPNGERDYDWGNQEYVESDCEDWKPDDTGKVQIFNCEQWYCDSLAFFKWWMQNIPGFANSLYHEGSKLKNWWDFIGDFDAAMAKGKSLTWDAACGSAYKAGYDHEYNVGYHAGLKAACAIDQRPSLDFLPRNLQSGGSANADCETAQQEGYDVGYYLGFVAGARAASANTCISNRKAMPWIPLLLLSETSDAGWVRLLGTESRDLGGDIAVDSTGNSYVCGYACGELDGKTYMGGCDIVIAKYDTYGAKKCVTLLGTPDFDGGYGIEVDSSGNKIYITGGTYGELDGKRNMGSADIFVAEYDTDCNKECTIVHGTPEWDRTNAIVVDSNGNGYVTGYTYGNLEGKSNKGPADTFIAKYKPGCVKQWVTMLGTCPYQISVRVEIA